MVVKLEEDVAAISIDVNAKKGRRIRFNMSSLITHPKPIVDVLCPSLEREGQAGACDGRGESKKNDATFISFNYSILA